MKLRLYHYWRSSCSWRVRWALAIKGIECEWAHVDLLSDEAESPRYRELNPTGYVPTLELIEAGRPSRFLGESVAILEWLEERFPTPPLLGGNAEKRALARQLAEVVNAGIQPLQNPNVTERHSADSAAQKEWVRHWIRKGLDAYQRLAEGSAGRFSIGDDPSYPDLFLIPQCYAAARFNVDLKSEFPLLFAIHAHALELPSCQASHPDRFRTRNAPPRREG